VGMRVN